MKKICIRKGYDMRAEEFVKKNLPDMIEDLKNLISIPTVYNPEHASEGKPFGPEVADGLEWILDKAADMGMEAKNIDGYAGEITVGNGDNMIGVLLHEDVVPAGDGWDCEPFIPHIEGDKLFGRGSSDDKGPLISSMYAVKYLKDEGKIPQDTSIRMIIGTNEEEAWECLNYYVDHVNRLPDYSIVPDGYFPLIFCEKGLLDVNMSINAVANDTDIKVIALKGGSGRSVVPGKAMITLEADEALLEKIAAEAIIKDEFEVDLDDNRLDIYVEGKSTHAMQPEKGLNAISVLLDFMGKVEYSISIGDAIKKYNDCIGMTYNGELLNINFKDELSGLLTFNVGVIEYKDEKLYIEANLRYPASMKKEYVVDELLKNCEANGFDAEIVEYLPPVYINPESDFMKILLGVYQEETGDYETEAFAIGGATYARGIPNAVAFGPLFPYETELAHEANEFISIKSLEKMTLIYIKALEKLVNLKH